MAPLPARPGGGALFANRKTMTDLPANAKPRGAIRRFLYPFASIAKPLVRHPATYVVLGIGLLLTGLLELIEATEVFALSDLELEGALRAGGTGDEISHHQNGAAAGTAPAPKARPMAGRPEFTSRWPS